MLNNMATSLFAHGRVITTEAKAKELRPFAEKLITLARRGDLHARRLVGRRIKDRETLGRLFTEIGPRFAARPGRLHPDPQAGPPARVTVPTSHGSSCLPSGRRSGGSPERQRGPSGPLFLDRLARRPSAARRRSAGLLDPVTLQALRADPDPLRRTLDQDPHGLEVGYQRRLVRLLAWLTLLPVTGPLAHTAHTRAISSTLILVLVNNAESP